MIKVGFIGAGDIAFLHGEGVKQADGAELVGIWNRTVKELKKKPGFSDCRVFNKPEELIQAVDVVYVLTNMETHYHTYRPHGNRGRQTCSCRKTYGSQLLRKSKI